MKKLILTLVLGLALPAGATSITGSMELTGVGTRHPHGFDFESNMTVTQSSGALATIASMASNIIPFDIKFKKPQGLMWAIPALQPGIPLAGMDVLTMDVIENTPGLLSLTGTASMILSGYSNTTYDYTLTDTGTDYTLTIVDPAMIPEPGTLLLVGIGLLALGRLIYERI